MSKLLEEISKIKKEVSEGRKWKKDKLITFEDIIKKHKTSLHQLDKLLDKTSEKVENIKDNFAEVMETDFYDNMESNEKRNYKEFLKFLDKLYNKLSIDLDILSKFIR